MSARSRLVLARRHGPASARESAPRTPEPLRAAAGIVYGLAAVMVFWAVVLMIAVIAWASASLRIAEDDAGWIPALYGNGQGHVSAFQSPFVAMER